MPVKFVPIKLICSNCLEEWKPSPKTWKKTCVNGSKVLVCPKCREINIISEDEVLKIREYINAIDMVVEVTQTTLPVFLEFVNRLREFGPIENCVLETDKDTGEVMEEA